MYPATAAAVVPVYNLPQLGNNSLVLDRSVLPKIFLGDIYLWNDTAVLALQDDATRAALLGLEDQTIRVVVRDDGSGTTEIFTKALSLFDPDGFGARIDAGDVIDWCEDGMEQIECASATYVDGVCTSNSSKFNCFGSKGECEGAAGSENWLRDTGFSTSGTVTCEKPVHGGRRWTYHRGATTVGLLAAVLQLEGSIGYTVLSDALTLDMNVAQMVNKGELGCELRCARCAAGRSAALQVGLRSRMRATSPPPRGARPLLLPAGPAPPCAPQPARW
jgi:hypothetical protein